MFGSTNNAILTLFMSVSGGMDWGEALKALTPLPLHNKVLFIGFIFFSIIAMLNIVTGMFVESVIGAAAMDRDNMIQERQSEARQYLHIMLELFGELDVNGTNSLSLEEFEASMKDDR